MKSRETKGRMKPIRDKRKPADLKIFEVARSSIRLQAEYNEKEIGYVSNW